MVNLTKKVKAMTEFGTKIGASIVEGYTVFKTVTLKYIMMNWKNYLFLIVLCLICASCAQEKKLPEPDAKTPITYMERREFQSFKGQVSKDGRIVSYSDYYDKQEKEFDENGYLIKKQWDWYSSWGHSTSQSSYNYDFDNDEKTLVYDENNTLITVYNHEGKLEKTYTDGKIDNLYFYNEDGKLSKRISYGFGSQKPVYEWVYTYSNNTKTEISYDYEEDRKVEGTIEKTFYDDDGDVIRKEEYSHYYGEKYLRLVKTYRNGNKIKGTYYHGDGSLDFYVESDYNSHDDVVQEVLHGSSGYKNVDEYRREYDQYGNPTLVVGYHYTIEANGQEYGNRYYIVIYNYTYSDGSKFIAKEEFPEVFGGRIIKENSGSTDSGLFNSGSDMYGGYSGGYNGGYNNEPYDGSSTTMRDHEAEKRDILNQTVGEDCPACKGSGKCSACNGTKVAHSFGNTYECTVCDQYGNCSVCQGTGKTSWNR